MNITPRRNKFVPFFAGILAFLFLLSSHASTAIEPFTWQRAIDRDNAAALWQLMPETDVRETNEKGKTALMSAAKLGDLDLVKALMQRGLKLTDRSNTGGTALMYAALGDQRMMIRYIHNKIEKKFLIDAKSTNGWTALMIAAAKGFDKTVKLLVELGADPSIADVYRWSPLMRAIDNRHTSVVNYLLSTSQVDINAVNENGSTALHIAALAGDISTAKLLLLRPELVHAVEDKAGKTAEDIATEESNIELLYVLRSLQ